MIEFKRVSVTDKAWVDKITRAEDLRCVDYCFGNIYLWNSTFRQRLSTIDDRLLMRLMYAEKPVFAFPVGSGDIRPAIDALTDYSAHCGHSLSLRAVTEEHRAILEDTYPGRFTFIEDRDNFDYIYLAEKLATYSGKKLHAKRNFCNRFEKTYDWEFVKLTKEHLPYCMKMLGDWQSEFEFPPSSLEDEHAAIIRGFMRFNSLGLEGGVLRAGGVVLGFSVGEVISSDTFDIHFEKAFANVPGAYPMVCREMTRMVLKDHPNIRYINREEDMGLESLRTSKLSYHPEYLLTKYVTREGSDV